MTTPEIDVKRLSVTFKTNLGTFLSRLQTQESNTTDNEATSNDNIENLLTDLDRVISNQKQLSELIQRVKTHQKLVRELDATDDSIKSTQASIIALIEQLQKKDFELAKRIQHAHKLKSSLSSLQHVLADPESALLASLNFAETTTAPYNWNPTIPLGRHRIPYPTEDLIRISQLYQLMTHSSKMPIDTSKETPTKMDIEPSTDELMAENSKARPSRRRGQVDKSKLLDLDLNP